MINTVFLIKGNQNLKGYARNHLSQSLKTFIKILKYEEIFEKIGKIIINYRKRQGKSNTISGNFSKNY